MPRPCPSLCLAVLLAGLSVAEPPRPAAAELPEYLALALPISGITVDGDLSDWPREMPALPIRNEFGIYGPTDTEGTDLDTSEDLSPSFRVGYDPQEQLLYVAVEVRDDVLYQAATVDRTDACEIYVSGLYGDDHSPIQYALVPGRLTYPQFDRRGVHHSRRSDRRSRGAWQRRGDVTSYEWRLQVRSGIPPYLQGGLTEVTPVPGPPLPLEGGGILGFDVVVVDGDGRPPDFQGPESPPWAGIGAASWVPWGPPVSLKMVGDELVGRLVLAPEDWSAGFDAGAMRTYLQGWVRDNPHDWNLGIRRDRLRVGGAVTPSKTRVPAPGDWYDSETPWREDPRGDWHMVLGGCLVGAAVSLAAVYAVRRRSGPDSSAVGPRLAALESRLAGLESRMTDTQDVMIALSEKVDRIDARDRTGGRAPAG